MSIEAILENYMNNPKWEGKIFMEDEKTCYKDGFNDGVDSCQLKIMQLKAQIEKMKNCWNCKYYNVGDTTCLKGKPHNSGGCFKDWELAE